MAKAQPLLSSPVLGGAVGEGGSVGAGLAVGDGVSVGAAASARFTITAARAS